MRSDEFVSKIAQKAFNHFTRSNFRGFSLYLQDFKQGPRDMDIRQVDDFTDDNDANMQGCQADPLDQ